MGEIGPNAKTFEIQLQIFILEIRPSMESHGKDKIRIAIQNLIAKLARATLESKNIPSYLKIHAPTVAHTLMAKGFVYYLRNPEGKLIPTLEHNTEALTPHTASIKEALSSVIEKQAHQIYTLQAGDTPIVETHWAPIFQDNTLSGILLFWFGPEAESIQTLRQEVLGIAAAELAFFLKLQAANTIPKEKKRLLAYTHLLEALVDDLSLQTIGWKLVNYAREALQCTRVCLLKAEGYAARASLQPSLHEQHFIIEACSGIKKVHPRSEQAVLLQNAAKALLILSSERGKEGAILAPVIAKRQPPSNVLKRPEPLILYFQKTPMHWVTAIPLYDAQNILCGTLLFEGQSTPENLQLSLGRMHTLARSAGVTLGKALYWHNNKPLRGAKKWAELKLSLTPTRKRSLLKQSCFILFAALAFVCIPLPHKIKGQASLTPEKQTIYASSRTAIIQSIAVRDGQNVPKGGLLYELDTKPVRLALAQARQSYYRLHTEADKERHQGNEGAMHQALIQAEAIATRIEQLKTDLHNASVYAPYDCVVLASENLSLKTGEVVLPGEVILKIANPSSWIVRTELREQDIVFLQHYLEENGPTSASLTLLAHPAERFPLELRSEEQLHYGEDPASDDYTYYAVFLLHPPEDEMMNIKEDYLGTVSIKTGWRSLAYTLFHDFWLFIQARTF